MPTCEIKWIDDAGNATPDTNPATCRVRVVAHDEYIAGQKIHFTESRWYSCCAEHAKQLTEPGMGWWECEPIPPQGWAVAG